MKISLIILILGCYPQTLFCVVIAKKIILFLPVRTLDEEKKLSYIFIFTLLCGAWKGFLKALKAFIKPFKAPQSSVKIKI